MTHMIPYTPNDWNDSQAKIHAPANLDEALHDASCLSGGWYRRPVAIWTRFDGHDERYALAPSEVTLGGEWQRVYILERIFDEV